MTLRVSALDGRVSITVPNHVPMRDIKAFVLEKEAWLEDTPIDEPVLMSVKMSN